MGLALEEVKLAVRMVHSLLDKAAFFLNCYMQLRIPEHKYVKVVDERLRPARR